MRLRWVGSGRADGGVGEASAGSLTPPGHAGWRNLLWIIACATGTVVLVAIMCWVRLLVAADGLVWLYGLGLPAALWVLAVVFLSRRRAGMSWPRSRGWRRILVGVAVCLSPALVLAGGCGWLLIEDIGTVSPSAHGSGADALWMGHAWVDGRRSPSDVDALANRVRDAGIHDLFVHAGPLSDDGSLNPALRPTAGWLLGALHQALPGVRVQAWLGNVVGDDHLRLDDAATQARVVESARQVLDDGFDGVHYDFEPVVDGSRSYVTLLAATHALTRARHAHLSVAADQIEPVPGMHALVPWLLGHSHWWSTGFLGEVAREVDEVAVMSYDSAMPLEAAYSGYIRVQTQLALQAVPPSVGVLIGVPAFHTDGIFHTAAETVSAAVRGLHLAVGDHAPRRPIGVAIYVDFAATPEDWAAYLTGWGHPG